MLLVSSVLNAQSSLALSSGAGPVGSPIPLALTLSFTAGSQPAGMQWTFSYPAASVTGFAVTAASLLTTAGKTLSCAGTSAAYTCIATGLNTNLIPAGIVANVSVTLAPAATSATPPSRY
jgi:hypothetical protein